MNGAQLTIKLLERQGIRTIAGIPGGANLPLYDALSQSTRIRHVLARHEQGAGFMAQGMARTTGKPAVFMATSGPGATNTLTALADAKLDSVPIICITGQVPLSMIGTDAFQEVDIYGMSIPATKHNFLIRSVDELVHVIPEAFRIAASGRPGPVLVDIPKDVQMAQVELNELPPTGCADTPHPPADADLQAAAALINRSRRPVFYLGGGVIQSDGCDLARELAEKASMAVVCTLMGLGGLDNDHPLYLGMLGMHAAPCANRALEECDLILAAGARFDDRATGALEHFCPTASVVHIDIDPAELGKLRTPHAAITADVRQAMQELLPLVSPRTRPEWRECITRLKTDHPLELPGLDDPATSYGLINHAARAAGPEAIVVTDVGQHQMRTAQAHPFLAPRRWLTSGGLGTMGFGLPTAIGAALAHPEATVTCFTGDGSLLMNIQEMATAAEHGLNVKIILADNNALGLVHQQQELFYQGKTFASTYTGVRTDFPALARAFGLDAVDLESSSAPGEDLAQAIQRPGPCLIRLPVRADDNVFPMVPPGAPNCQMIGEKANVCA